MILAVFAVEFLLVVAVLVVWTLEVCRRAK